MSYSLDYIYDNIMYDVIIDHRTKYHGPIDYISSHFGDGNMNEVRISSKQPKELQEFVDSFFEAKKEDVNLTLEQYYKSKAI